MIDELDQMALARSGQARKAALGVGAALLAIAAFGVFMVFRLVEQERQRDLRAWQVTLGIVADSRVAAIEEWLESQFAVVRELAENPSLQLYMTELALAGGQLSGITDEAAQAGYLRNLLQASAEREGFAPPPRGGSVAANLLRSGSGGLALLDPTGRVLVRSNAMPGLEGPIAEALRLRKPGERTLIDLHLNGEGDPTIGFVAPIHAVQGESGAQREIGLVLGLRTAAEALQRRLAQPGETAKTAESYLVRGGAHSLTYLSQLGDGTPPLKRQMALDTADLDAALALRRPGGFGEANDHANTPVLFTSRPVAGTAWLLVRKIGAGEALHDTFYRGRVMLFGFIGAIAMTAVLLLLVWRHGTSLRAAHAAERFRLLAERFGSLSRFMRLVTDKQPTVIQAVDPDGRFTFANQQAASFSGIAAEDIVGKDLPSVLGPAKALPLDKLNREVLVDGQPASATHTMTIGGEERIIKSDHIPLQPDQVYTRGGVLMVLEDITDLVRERVRREQGLRQLVSTLVAVVDRRDPYSAHHSARVAEVAKAIAEEMRLDAVAIETTEIAASLMNLGKIGVPSQLLTKTEPLSEQELRLIRESVLASADLLKDLEFEGPVGETLRQMQEHWDGSGEPAGLQGEQILLTARIVAVANAFVGMVSARAYRDGLEADRAADLLLQAAGQRFDRRPVMALVNIIENRGGRERFRSFGEPPQKRAAS